MSNLSSKRYVVAIRARMENHNIVGVTKVIRTLSGAGLKEAQDWVDTHLYLRNEFRDIYDAPEVEVLLSLEQIGWLEVERSRVMMDNPISFTVLREHIPQPQPLNLP